MSHQVLNISNKIKLYGLIFLIATINGKITRNRCDIISDDPTRRCFLKETLVTMSHSPNQLAVDKMSNTLYFSFDVGKGDYIPAILNLETRNLAVLKGVKDAFALASDNYDDFVYFGGSHGIYKYSARKKSLQRLNIVNLDIWWLFIKKNIFFIKFPSLSAFYYVNKTVKPVPELKGCMVHQFVMDTENDIFFLNGTGLYTVKANTNLPILVKKHPRFIGITTDSNGYVHVCNEDGIYVVRKTAHKVRKIVDVKGVLGITFDNSNNLIYSNSHEIVRLVTPGDGNNYNVDYDT